MHKDGSTASVSGRSFVLISTDNQDLVGSYTCVSPAALAAWLERQNEMLADSSLPLSWSSVARLAWSGRCVFVVMHRSSAGYVLAPDGVFAYYRQDGQSFTQFEPSVFSFEDFLEARVL